MRRVKNIFCIAIAAAMLFSTMGIGTFAATDGIDAGGASGETSTEVNTTEEVTSEPAVTESEDLNSDALENDKATEPVVIVKDVPLNATVGSGTATISWSKGNMENKPVNISRKSEKESDFTVVAKNVTGSSYKDTKLTNGVSYTYRVETEVLSQEPDVTVEPTEATGGEDKATLIQGESDSNTVAQPYQYKGEITVVPNSIKVYAYSGYLSVHLKWKHVKGATKYIITRTTNSKKFTVYPGSKKVGEYIEYRDLSDKTKGNGTGLNWDTRYYYYVQAYYTSTNGDVTNSVTPLKSNSVSQKCVRPMYYKITFNKKRTLTSHDGKKKKYTFKKGTKVYAHAFAAGKYKFYYKINGKGYLFYVNKLSTYKTGSKKRTAVYLKSSNYSITEAEYFVNDVKTFKPTSKGKYLIFTSGYCQHTYIFQSVYSGGKYVWKPKTVSGKYKHWESATGKANSPSPWFKAGHKINKKKSKRHNISYWSCFSGWNAYHGKLKSWKLGKPASGGCIRNNVSDAKYVYKYLPKNTRVIIY